VSSKTRSAAIQQATNRDRAELPWVSNYRGFAQDVSVKNLSTDDKKKLKTKIESKGLNIYMELVTGTESQYGVSLEQANVFHVYSVSA
jgi:hypothetical protein